MALSDADVKVLGMTRAAAMITIGADGRPKAARVAVALLDGALLSSGTADRVRTRRLRDDPRCTLYVHPEGPAWRAMEATVHLDEGPDAHARTLRLFREMQGKPEGPVTWYGRELDEAAFLARMAEEGRLLYEFEVHRSYGLS